MVAALLVAEAVDLRGAAGKAAVGILLRPAIAPSDTVHGVGQTRGAATAGDIAAGTAHRIGALGVAHATAADPKHNVAACGPGWAYRVCRGATADTLLIAAELASGTIVVAETRYAGPRGNGCIAYRCCSTTGNAAVGTLWVALAVGIAAVAIRALSLLRAALFARPNVGAVAAVQAEERDRQRDLDRRWPSP